MISPLTLNGNIIAETEPLVLKCISVSIQIASPYITGDLLLYFACFVILMANPICFSAWTRFVDALGCKRIGVFGDGSALLCSVSMWAVQMQCPLTDNSISYFSQGFQGSWVQDVKERHAVVAELTDSERNRKRWQSIFEINTWTLADKKPCQKKDGARAKSLRHWLLPCRLPMRNSGLS